MTLILATIMKNGAVLAADRRTIVFSHSTGEESILTDEAEKIFASNNAAIAVVGDSKGLSDTAEKLVRSWLASSYDPQVDFEQQLKKLYQDSFKSGDYGYFVAIQCRADKTTVITTRDNFEVEAFAAEDRSVIKYFGSGNTVAARLVDQAKPKFGKFEPEAILDFSAVIIQTTHDELEKDDSKLNPVGRNVMAAVITQNSTKLLFKIDDK